MLCVAALGSSHGCADSADLHRIEDHGGHWIPNGEIPFITVLPVQHIWFDRPLDDAEFAAIVPTLIRVPSERLTLNGDHLTDKSIAEVNQLDGVQRLYLNTRMTRAGIQKLKLPSLRELSLPSDFSDEEVAAIKKTFPGTNVWRSQRNR